MNEPEDIHHESQPKSPKPAQSESDSMEVRQNPLEHSVDILATIYQRTSGLDIPKEGLRSMVRPERIPTEFQDRLVRVGSFYQRVDSLLNDSVELLRVPLQELRGDVDRWQRNFLRELWPLLARSETSTDDLEGLLSHDPFALIDRMGEKEKTQKWREFMRWMIIDAPSTDGLMAGNLMPVREEPTLPELTKFKPLIESFVASLPKPMGRYSGAVQFGHPPEKKPNEERAQDPAGHYLAPEAHRLGGVALYPELFIQYPGQTTQEHEAEMYHGLLHEAVGHGLDPRFNQRGRYHLSSFSAAMEMLAEWRVFRVATIHHQEDEVHEYPASIGEQEDRTMTEPVRDQEDFAESVAEFFIDQQALRERSFYRYKLIGEWVRETLGPFKGK